MNSHLKRLTTIPISASLSCLTKLCEQPTNPRPSCWRSCRAPMKQLPTLRIGIAMQWSEKLTRKWIS